MIDLFLFALSVCVTIPLLRLVQPRAKDYLSLRFVVIVSLFLAYPLKAFLISLSPDQFKTFAFDGNSAATIYLLYILNVLFAVVVIAMLPKEPVHSTASCASDKTLKFPELYLLLVAFVLLLFYADRIAEFSFLDNAVRRESLRDQFGAGWSTLLMQCSFPLLYLAIRFGKQRFFVWIGCVILVLVFLTVGSRAYLLGALIVALCASFRLSLPKISVVLLCLAAAGALIGALSWGELDVDLVGSILFARLMHTFDGADLMNAYMQSGVGLQFGVTIVEDFFLQYFPRALWEGKPFLFGSNELTSRMFPELSDVVELTATFPAGFFLEQYANFSYLGLFWGALMLCMIFSLRPYSGNRLHEAAYFSLVAFAPTFFRSAVSFFLLLLIFLSFVHIVRLVERIALNGLRRSLEC